MNIDWLSWSLAVLCFLGAWGLTYSPLPYVAAVPLVGGVGFVWFALTPDGSPFDKKVD